MTRVGRMRVILGLLILAASIVILTWGILPARRETRIQPASEATLLVLAESRTLKLVFPPRPRLGDLGVVQLTLGMDSPNGLVPAADIGPAKFYDSHTVIAEARFDLPGMDIRPSDLISAPISQGGTPVFYWTLRPRQAGRVRGTIWLYLRSIDKLTGEEKREAVSAQIVEIEPVSFLGLRGDLARPLGAAGAIVGLGLSLPFFEALIRLLIHRKS